MAYRNFPGKTQSWLETQLDAILDEQASGKTLIGGSSAEINYQAQAQQSIEARKSKILWDLYVLDPVTYPRDTIAAPKVTVAVFRDSNGRM